MTTGEQRHFYKSEGVYLFNNYNMTSYYTNSVQMCVTDVLYYFVPHKH